MKQFSALVFALALVMFSVTQPVFAKSNDVDAVVIASFGTSYPEALPAITTIDAAIRKAFPKAVVTHAFTSDIIRKIWHERVDDTAFRAAHPEIPEDLYTVRSPLGALAALSDAGYRNVVVQSTHIYAGEEYGDLTGTVEALAGIRSMKEKWNPFTGLVMGRPALGRPGMHPDYHEDIAEAAKALSADAAAAKEQGAVLVYMGHGNEYFSTGAYIEFEKEMNRRYPHVKTLVGTVEGYPTLEDVVAKLDHIKAKKVLLKPFMVVAGDHARNDMAGEEDDSWKEILSAKGIAVTCILKGLGENETWAELYARRAKDAAKGL